MGCRVVCYMPVLSLVNMPFNTEILLPWHCPFMVGAPHMNGLFHGKAVSPKITVASCLGKVYISILFNVIWLIVYRNLPTEKPLLWTMIYQTVPRKELQVNYLCINYSKVFSLWKTFTELHHAYFFIFSNKKCLVKPRRGDALLFFSLLPNAIPDPMSLHAGCPVIEGEKWSATKWIHVDSFDKILGGADGKCVDQNASCERWAALGECTKNPEYMVGSTEIPGYCRRSCKVC